MLLKIPIKPHKMIKEITLRELNTGTSLPFDLLEQLAAGIIKEVQGVVSVTYNITTKPPSTIEAV
jgi:GMP synthase (glutamine-hydrolysing)